MNINYQSDGEVLEVTLTRDFNYNTVHYLQKLYKGENAIHIDLKNAKFVDSEAIIYLHNLMNSGCEITLLETPPILIECLRILSLEKVWKHNITIMKRT